MSTAAAAVAEGIAGWLLRHRDARGRVRDSVHGEYGTYADGFAALVFGLMADRTGEDCWGEACVQSCRIALRRPADSEFDQFALLLLAGVTYAPRLGAGEIPANPASIRLYRGRRLVSNNWITMRAVSFSLRAKHTGSKEDARTASRLWERVLAWQLPDGLFVDSPVGVATPLTYHAKFCAMLVMALRLTPEHCPAEPLRKALEQGLRALERLVSPSGTLAPYGRSRNALFGYAAAFFALRCGGSLLRNPGYLVPAHRLVSRLAEACAEDGHIPCVLNEGEREKRDWDVYVNNPDYNAYAAAFLLLAERLWAAPEPPGSEVPAEPDVRRVGPLVVVRSGGFYAVLSAEGQSAPYGTPFFCDFRYYGLQPLYIEIAGEAVFEPRPYQWPGAARSVLVDPAASGAYLDLGGVRYGARVYDEVEVTRDGPLLRLRSEATPEAYLPVSRLERALRRLLGRAPLQFRSRHLVGTRWSRTLTLDTGTGHWEASTAADPPDLGLAQGEQRGGPE